ncbi:hypothetical protein NDU88_008143 [Pleurodeles waltl]|uniref:Uncharacterized protein n=1 Tax=Pleurodeles waltl TaxID=8319 RepID=A0AAV7VRQ3_PLEWA|nr:hypothetical protein NDU88_008143 [Pleurodeles waltl]
MASSWSAILSSFPSGPFDSALLLLEIENKGYVDNPLNCDLIPDAAGDLLLEAEMVDIEADEGGDADTLGILTDCGCPNADVSTSSTDLGTVSTEAIGSTGKEEEGTCCSESCAILEASRNAIRCHAMPSRFSARYEGVAASNGFTGEERFLWDACLLATPPAW